MKYFRLKQLCYALNQLLNLATETVTQICFFTKFADKDFAITYEMYKMKRLY